MAPPAIAFVLMLLATAPLASADSSWIQAYNAGFVRVRASGAFQSILAAADPMLLSSVGFIADCPAVPDGYPFPPWLRGSRLDAIFTAGRVVVARQLLRFAAYEKAFEDITRGIVAEIAAAYGVSLDTKFVDYMVSDPAVQAVASGAADCTDPFYRQWTLVVPTQVQRSVQLTPACTMWASTLSISFLAGRNQWTTLEGARRAPHARQPHA